MKCNMIFMYSKKNNYHCLESLSRTIKCVIFLLFILMIYINNVDAEFVNETLSSDFVARCRRDCVIKRDVVVCGKYRVARWLNQVVREKEFSYGPVKLIKIPSMTEEEILPNVSKAAKNYKFGVADTLNFLRELAEEIIKRRALVYTFQPALTTGRTFSNAPIVVDEDQLAQMQKGATDGARIFHKKKKAIIFPILILLNLIKLKMMLIPIFLGVHLIKKLIIIGGLFVPGFLSKLRICKVPHHGLSFPFHWGTAAEAPVDYPSGYGNEDPGWSHRNDIYPGLGAGYPAPYHYPVPGYYRQR
ncbi:uncharacterized protein LOC103571738 [Microplitis demolitor]|uniref:uncharacterized protein LOC103571738 n=1 Tax=Microplitis demolitor TaxID=69319 RepID=UPI00044000E6|nr:uncharacterized protein LOC103571738 [Microplitis demolitor]